MFRSLLRRIEWGNARIGVINENLANVNTPDYVATDLEPLSSKKREFVPLVTTDEQHCARMNTINVPHARVKDLDATRSDGHIDINEQLVKLQETYTESTLMVKSFEKFASFYRIVLKG
ncbi:MAG: hypothetical protein LBQ26_02440 [Holosporales bacterium]|jgi:flagellar basal body rod protein FlgB|nr:hypothetical protein [Holosporales bacterium]